MALRPCLGRCGQLVDGGSYCQRCKPRPQSPGRVTGRRWQQIRAHVFAVHGERCAACGATGVPLQVHHRDHDHLNNAISNLIPLCRPCHAKAGIRAA